MSQHVAGPWEYTLLVLSAGYVGVGIGGLLNNFIATGFALVGVGLALLSIQYGAATRRQLRAVCERIDQRSHHGCR